MLGRITGEKSILWRKIFTTVGIRIRNGFCYSTMSDEKILQPLSHLVQVPGKQIRKKVVHACSYWMNVTPDKLNVLADVVEAFHNSILLIDDVEDNSTLRRGIPTAHTIYGVPSTINAANYLLLTGLKMARNLDHPEAVTVCTEQMLETYRGLGMDIYWRDNCICPSIEEYKEMASGKAGGLFMMDIRLMLLFSDNRPDVTKLAETLWLYYQVRDDYCNLCVQEYSKTKGYCEDITEGKFSFPIIHAIKSHPDDNQVMNILRQRTRDEELKKYCVTLLDQFGSLSYTRRTLEELDAETRAEVVKLGGNPVLEALLDELCNWKGTYKSNPEQ